MKRLLKSTLVILFLMGLNINLNAMKGQSSLDFYKFPEPLKNSILDVFTQESRAAGGDYISKTFKYIPLKIDYDYREFLPRNLVKARYLDPKTVYFIGALFNKAKTRNYKTSKLVTKADKIAFFKQKPDRFIKYMNYNLYRNNNFINKITELLDNPSGLYVTDYFTNYYKQVINAARDSCESGISISPADFNESELESSDSFEMPPLPYFDYSKLRRVSSSN